VRVVGVCVRLLLLPSRRRAQPDTIKEVDVIASNFIIANYASLSALDTDDGSCYYTVRPHVPPRVAAKEICRGQPASPAGLAAMVVVCTCEGVQAHSNVLAYASMGQKSYENGHDEQTYNNIFVYIGSEAVFDQGGQQVRNSASGPHFTFEIAAMRSGLLCTQHNAVSVPRGLADPWPPQLFPRQPGYPGQRRRLLEHALHRRGWCVCAGFARSPCVAFHVLAPFLGKM
jgi:hypothetical protein